MHTVFFFSFLLTSFVVFSLGTYVANTGISDYNYSFFALINIFLWCSYWYFNAILNAIFFFFMTYRIYDISRMCIVINYISLAPIHLIFSLVHFKNVHEYFTMVFIPLLRFLLHSLAWGNFHVLLRYIFFFFFFHLCLCPLPIFPSTCNFPFLQELSCFPAYIFLDLILITHV